MTVILHGKDIIRSPVRVWSGALGLEHISNPLLFFDDGYTPFKENKMGPRRFELRTFIGIDILTMSYT